jgi:hypothetical protein
MQKALADFKEGTIGLNECWRWHYIQKTFVLRDILRAVYRGVCDHSNK